MANLGALLPLIILFVIIGVGGFVGYHIYVWSNELTERGKNKMAKKNMSFTKDGGLRVGVKQMQDEQYADKTQNVLVNVWNNASLPNYKSKLGWNSTQSPDPRRSVKQGGDSSSSSRPAAGSRTSSSSSSSRPSNSRSNTTSVNAAANLSPPELRPSVKRVPSTPGSWS